MVTVEQSPALIVQMASAQLRHLEFVQTESAQLDCFAIVQFSIAQIRAVVNRQLTLETSRYYMCHRTTPYYRGFVCQTLAV